MSKPATTGTLDDLVARLTRIANMAAETINTGGREEFDPRGVEDDIREAIEVLTKGEGRG